MAEEGGRAAEAFRARQVVGSRQWGAGGSEAISTAARRLRLAGALLCPVEHLAHSAGKHVGGERLGQQVEVLGE